MIASISCRTTCCLAVSNNLCSANSSLADDGSGVRDEYPVYLACDLKVHALVSNKPTQPAI